MILSCLVGLHASGCAFSFTSNGKTVTVGGPGDGDAREVEKLAAESSKLRYAGRIEDAERVGRLAMERARKAGNPALVSAAGQSLGITLAVMERYDEAGGIASEVRQQGSDIAALNIEAAADLYRCEFDAAAGKYLDVRRASKGKNVGPTEGNLALVDVWEGRFERAAERFEHAAAVFRDKENDGLQAATNEKYMVLSTAAAAARAGQPARAASIIKGRGDLPDLVVESLAFAEWASREKKSLFQAHQGLMNAIVVEKALGDREKVARLRARANEIIDLYEGSDSPCRRQIPSLLAIEAPATLALLERRVPSRAGASGAPSTTAAQEPPPDRDGDGIPDSGDKCADEPETINGLEDADGCPDQAAGYLAGREIHLREQIPFAFDSDRIEEKGKPTLDWLASFITSHPAISAVSIEGHTDDQGEDDYNLKLSRKRAEAVVAALVQRGVPGSRLSAIGYGETRPKILGTDEAHRAANRRVEILATVTEQVVVMRGVPMSGATGSQETAARSLAEMTIAGSLDREHVHRVVHGRWSAIQDCYMSSPGASAPGRTAIKFIITDSGSVQMAAVAESSLNSSAADDCIAAQIRALQFDPPEGGGIVVVNYPFWFEPNGAGDSAEAGAHRDQPSAIAPPSAEPSSEANATPASPVNGSAKLTRAPADIPCDGECIALLARLDEDDLEDAVVSDYTEGAAGSSEALLFYRRKPGGKGWERMPTRTEAVVENLGGHSWTHATVLPAADGGRAAVCVEGELAGRSVVYAEGREVCFWWKNAKWTARNGAPQAAATPVSEPQKIDGRWVVMDDGTVLDEATGLMWTRGTSPEALPLRKAKAYCAKLKTGGHKDWKLPDVEQLKTIVTCDSGDSCCKKIGSCRKDTGYQWNQFCGECVPFRVWGTTNACFRNEKVWQGACDAFWSSDTMKCAWSDLKPKGKAATCALQVTFRAPGVGKYTVGSIANARCVRKPQ